MMKKEVIKKVLAWAFLFFLMAGLLAAVYLVKRQQETRRGAVGTGEVQFRLFPDSGTKYRGEEFIVEVRLFAGSAKQVTVAGADLEFNSSFFQVSEVECHSNFGSAGPENGVVGNNIYLTCYRYDQASGPQSPLLLAGGGSLVLGSFKVKVKPNAALGNTAINFTRTRFPDPVTFADLADQGVSAQFIISLVPTPTPTTSPIPTNTPGPTATLTPTTSPDECSCDNAWGRGRKALGDGNCDGNTNIVDYNAWFEVFIKNNQAYQGLADFDCNGRVSIDDYEAWRINSSF